MTTPIISDLPTVDQQAEADGLRRLLQGLGPGDVAPEPPTAAVLRERIPFKASWALRETVARGFEVLSRAGLTGTPLRDLRSDELHWQFAARLALDELGRREARALGELQAQPPAWLIAAIGRPTLADRTAAGGMRGSWLRVTTHVMAYRQQYNITDPTRALGANPTPASPVSLARETDWRYAMGEISWSAGNLGEHLRDPTVLAVFDATGRVNLPQALGVLGKETADQTSLSEERQQRIRAAPSHLLRRRVTETFGLLGQRRADRSAELDRLETARENIAVLYRQELLADDCDLGQELSRKGRGQHEHGHLQRRLRGLDATIEQLRRAQYQRAAWNSRNELILATGRMAAEELALREHEVLLLLEQDPPEYLVAELGRPPDNPAGLATWQRGVRLIERFRTRHEVDDPDRAFGRDDDARHRDHLTRIREELDLVKDGLRRGPEPPALPAPSSQDLLPDQ